jgi:hypothetical protein
MDFQFLRFNLCFTSGHGNLTERKDNQRNVKVNVIHGEEREEQHENAGQPIVES